MLTRASGLRAMSRLTGLHLRTRRVQCGSIWIRWMRPAKKCAQHLYCILRVFRNAGESQQPGIIQLSFRLGSKWRSRIATVDGLAGSDSYDNIHNIPNHNNRHYCAQQHILLSVIHHYAPFHNFGSKLQHEAHGPDAIHLFGSCTRFANSTCSQAGRRSATVYPPITISIRFPSRKPA